MREVSEWVDLDLLEFINLKKPLHYEGNALSKIEKYTKKKKEIKFTMILLTTGSTDIHVRINLPYVKVYCLHKDHNIYCFIISLFHLKY
jgi:hypothetical protein